MSVRAAAAPPYKEASRLSGERFTRRRRARGFTLIELIVVIAIGALLAGSVTVAITNIRKADLKAATGMLSGAMRYMYNLAVINNRPYRLVIDMDESKFWGEQLQTDDPCGRFLPEGDPLADASDREKELEESGKDPEEEGPRGLDPRRRVTSTVQAFQGAKDNLLSIRDLPRGIRVTGVMTTNHEGPREEGKVAIHFFPGGYADPAYVWIGEEEDPDEPAEPSVTLSLDSLMGRVTRHGEALDPSSFAKEME